MYNSIEFLTKESTEFPGYYKLDGFSKYVINTDGLVLNRSGRALSPIQIKKSKPSVKGGYIYLALIDDAGQRKFVGRHRLLCLTFKRKPASEKTLIVNHINGIPGDDRLENLEWVTYSQNTLHAYQSGLYSKIVSVDVLHDDVVTTYSSIMEASRATGVDDATIRNRLRRMPGRLYSDGYAFKVEGVGMWVTDTIQIASTATQVMAKSLATGQADVYNSARQCALACGIKPASLHVALRRESRRLLGGYEFKYLSDETDWSELSQKQIDLHLKYPHGKYPMEVILTDNHGHGLRFDSALLASDFLSCEQNAIMRAAKLGKRIQGYAVRVEKIL